jgi:hypothetical protein
VAWGEATNRHRDWHDGNHPGYVLARRLAAKAEQVWTVTRHFAVPWTNNASEQIFKGPKRHQAVSGYWHTMATLSRYCRVRSYLVIIKGHGIRALDAIHSVLAGHPWLPNTHRCLNRGHPREWTRPGTSARLTCTALTTPSNRPHNQERKLRGPVEPRPPGATTRSPR